MTSDGQNVSRWPSYRLTDEEVIEQAVNWINFLVEQQMYTGTDFEEAGQDPVGTAAAVLANRDFFIKEVGAHTMDVEAFKRYCADPAAFDVDFPPEGDGEDEEQQQQ